MKIEDIAFTAEDITLAGQLRRPEPWAPAPAVVLSGPFTGVKDQVVASYAARLTEAGLITLASTTGALVRAAAGAGTRIARGSSPTCVPR